MMLVRDYGEAMEDAPVAVELLPIDGSINQDNAWLEVAWKIWKPGRMDRSFCHGTGSVPG